MATRIHCQIPSPKSAKVISWRECENTGTGRGSLHSDSQNGKLTERCRWFKPCSRSGTLVRRQQEWRKNRGCRKMLKENLIGPQPHLSRAHVRTVDELWKADRVVCLNFHHFLLRSLQAWPHIHRQNVTSLCCTVYINWSKLRQNQTSLVAVLCQLINPNSGKIKPV